METPQRRRQVDWRDEVWEGVVEGDHDVEWPRDHTRKRADVGDVKGDGGVEARRLALCALDGSRAHVRRGHLVAAEREADRLGADPTGRIKDGPRTFGHLRPDGPVDDLALSEHRRVPVREDGRVVIGQLVVERRATSSGRQGFVMFPSWSAIPSRARFRGHVAARSSFTGSEHEPP